MTYVAADDRYDHMRYRRCGAQRAAACPPSRSGSGTTSAATGRSRRSARSCAARSTSASRTSTSRTTTGRRTARRRRTSAGCSQQDLAAVPRRADHLDQGRLRHVARPVRRRRLAQVPAREPRPEPGADGARLRRHLLLPPARPRHAARGDDGRARHRRAAGQGALRRHLVLLGRARRARRAAILRELGTPLLIHQPSYSMLEPLDRAGPARRRSATLGVGCIALLAARPGPAHRPLPRTASRRARARAATTSLSPDTAHRRDAGQGARAERDRRRPRPVPRPDGAGLDAARPADDLDAHRREQRRAARAEPRRAGQARRSPPTSSPRSTGSRPSCRSTSGRARARTSAVATRREIDMEYRRLGSSDLMSRRSRLGSWLTFGSRVERDRAAACVDRAFDLGHQLHRYRQRLRARRRGELPRRGAREAGRATPTCSRPSSTSR